MWDDTVKEDSEVPSPGHFNSYFPVTLELLFSILKSLSVSTCSIICSTHIRCSSANGGRLYKIPSGGQVCVTNPAGRQSHRIQNAADCSEWALNHKKQSKLSYIVPPNVVVE
jgi:hypothetical protein